MNISAVLTAILAAIAVLAMLVPGLDALKVSIISLSSAKAEEVRELCYARIAQQKIRLEDQEVATSVCIGDKSDEITAKFKVAIDMIDTLRNALTAEAASAASAANPSSGGTGV